MALLDDVEWEACLLEPRRDRELERFVRRGMGGVPSSVPYFAASPWIVRSLVVLERVPLVHVDFALADLVGLVVAQDSSCRFCYAAQRTQMRLQGFSRARIRRLEEGLFEAQLAVPEKAALDFARGVSRADPSALARQVERLRGAGWSETAIRELAFLAASHVYFNRLHTLPAIPPQRAERTASHWVLDWVAPLAGRRLRAYQRRGALEPPSEALGRGPFADPVLGLGGLPAARALREVIDEAWASPLLARRARALVFAVIARGLGCASSEQDARRALAGVGIGEAETEAALAHLGSPALDATETAIIHFARNTIRPRPAEIQRRARTLLDAMAPDALLDLVGVAALANAVCRIGVTLAVL